MENKVFLVLVLFGLVTMGLAIQQEEYVKKDLKYQQQEDGNKDGNYESNIPDNQAPNYSDDNGEKGYKDKLSKQGYGKPNIQVYHYVSKSEKSEKDHSDEDHSDFDIKSILSQLHHQESHHEGAGYKKDDKSSEHHISKDLNKEAKAALKKKIAKINKLQRSLKHNKERHHTKEHKKEKVKHEGGDEVLSAMSPNSIL